MSTTDRKKSVNRRKSSRRKSSRRKSPRKKSSRKKSSQRKLSCKCRKKLHRKRSQKGGDRMLESHQEFINALRNNPNALRQKETVNNYTYVIYGEPNDHEMAAKIKGIKKAITLLLSKGIQLPPDLEFILTGDINQQTIAFQKSAAEINVNVIQLGPQRTGRLNPPIALPTGVLLTHDPIKVKNAMSTCGILPRSLNEKQEICPQHSPLCPCPLIPQLLRSAEDNIVGKVTITVIHEIAHLLHAIQSPEIFWQQSGRPDYASASQISQYAAGSTKEFVAEVFSAYILGYRLPNEILEAYKMYGGPRLP